MKKILSTVIAAAIAVIMPISSFAAEDTEINQDSQEKNGSITVDYNMDWTYTVTIPASVTFTDTEKTVERALEVRGVVIDEGKSINVSVSSLNDFEMKNGNGYIDYYLMVNHNTISENNYNILTVNAGEGSGWAVLSFVTELQKNHALYSGRYTDTLTFTVSVI